MGDSSILMGDPTIILMGDSSILMGDPTILMGETPKLL
jgi:hypothetical protein